MSVDAIDKRVVLATLAKMGETFRTKQLSGHADMIAGHPELSRERNYHAFVGKYLSLYCDEVEKAGRKNNEAVWRNKLKQASGVARAGSAAGTDRTAKVAAVGGRSAKTRAGAARTGSTGSGPVRRGHYETLEYMLSSEFGAVKALFESEPEIGGVYLRPTDRGVTVVDLHPGSPKPRVGVGADPYISVGTRAEQVAPTMAERVRYLRGVRARQAGPSLENQFEARMMREAQGDHLRIPGFPDRLRFIHSQWRIDKPGGTGQQFTDLLAVDLVSRHLVIIELKREPVIDRTSGNGADWRRGGAGRRTAARAGSSQFLGAGLGTGQDMRERGSDLCGKRALNSAELW